MASTILCGSKEQQIEVFACRPSRRQRTCLNEIRKMEVEEEERGWGPSLSPLRSRDRIISSFLETLVRCLRLGRKENTLAAVPTSYITSSSALLPMRFL